MVITPESDVVNAPEPFVVTVQKLAVDVASKHVIVVASESVAATVPVAETEAEYYDEEEDLKAKEPAPIEKPETIID